LDIVCGELQACSFGSSSSQQDLLEELWLVNALDDNVGARNASSSLSRVFDLDGMKTKPGFEPALRQDDIGDKRQENVLLGLIDSKARAEGWCRGFVDHVLARDIESSSLDILSSDVTQYRKPQNEEQAWWLETSLEEKCKLRWRREEFEWSKEGLIPIP